METAPAKPRILRLFISYAHEDPNVQVVKKTDSRADLSESLDAGQRLIGIKSA